MLLSCHNNCLSHAKIIWDIALNFGINVNGANNFEYVVNTPLHFRNEHPHYWLKSTK